MMRHLYSTLRWRTARVRALERDGSRCTVGRLLGGDCTTRLHVHHVISVAQGGDLYDLDNLATVCSRHHPTWEALRGAVMERLTDPGPRCRHVHRTREARELCERRLARATSRSSGGESAAA